MIEIRQLPDSNVPELLITPQWLTFSLWGYIYGWEAVDHLYRLYLSIRRGSAIYSPCFYLANIAATIFNGLRDFAIFFYLRFLFYPCKHPKFF